MGDSILVGLCGQGITEVPLTMITELVRQCGWKRAVKKAKDDQSAILREQAVDDRIAGLMLAGQHASEYICMAVAGTSAGIAGLHPPLLVFIVIGSAVVAEQIYDIIVSLSLKKVGLRILVTEVWTV